MGASAGTGVRSFSEGGSTSTPSSSAPTAPQRAIYQPQYTDYGLGSTPQAQGPLASMLNMGNYGSQMPTFTRPQAVAPQANYQVAYKPPAPKRGAVDPNLAIINQALAPAGPQYDSDGVMHPAAPKYMDQAQLDTILADPGKYVEYIKHVQGGGDPAKYVRQPQPIAMMSKTQLDALKKKQQRELRGLLPPAYVPDQGGS